MTILFRDSFENGIDDSKYRITHTSPAVVSEPNRTGVSGCEFALSKTTGLWDGTNSSVAQELRVKGIKPVVGNKYWYTFSVFFPEDYQGSDVAETIIQFQAESPVGVGGPNIAIRRIADGDTLQLRVRSNAGATHDKENNKVKSYSLGAYEKGEWIDITLRIKWGWNATNDPFVTVYTNEDWAATHFGPNMYREYANAGQRVRFGLYIPSWRHTLDLFDNVIVYHGGAIVGDADESMKSMQPQTAVTPPTIINTEDGWVWVGCQPRSDGEPINLTVNITID